MDIQVIIADNHPEVRSALRLLLAEKRGVNAVSEASKSEDLMSLVRCLKPDLILLDWELPGFIPEETMLLMHNLYRTPAVIALGSRPQMRKAALAAGAEEFIYKSEPPEKLLAVLDRFIPERPPCQPQDC